MLSRVLVVDDAELLIKMYREILSRYACEVLVARNGQEALDALEQGQRIDLIILDINMPVMDGMEFLEAIAPQGIPREIPIIIATAEKMEGNAFIELGARGYLKKPFKPASLRDLIDSIVSPPSTC